jgi:hypothetical protein
VQLSSKLRFHYECSTLYGKKRARLCSEPYTGEMVEVSGDGGTPMPTSKEYRQHAEECLELAKQAEEFYVKTALVELADEFKEQAEKSNNETPFPRRGFFLLAGH